MAAKSSRSAVEECRTKVLTPWRAHRQRGARSEAALLHAPVAAGKTVLLPWGGHHRYDFVLDEGGGVYIRVQCKTGVLKRGGTVLRFRACSADARRPNGVPYQGQVDAFGVYCPENGSAYLVPMAELNGITSVVSLRLVPARSGQRAGIRLAALYRLG